LQNRLDHLKGLLELSKSANLSNGHFDEFVKEGLLSLSEYLEVARASFWLWNIEDESIINQNLYSSKEKSFSKGEILRKKDFPNYFDAFQNSLLISAENAQDDIRTAEFYNSYLKPNSIKSMLDVQVLVNSNLFGIICLEQTDSMRTWKKKDELYISTVAAYFSQCCLNSLRAAEVQKRRQSETNFKILYMNNPIPMWVYDPDSFKFLTVNDAAITEYGYSREEFSKMTIMDIRPPEDKIKLKKHLELVGHQNWMSLNWLHQYKDGTIINVEIASDWTKYNDKQARMVLAINKTNELKLLNDKEEYISKLSDYAFYASHNLRAPVASILGLVDIITTDWENRNNYKQIIERIKTAAKELDQIISNLNSKVDL